MVLNPLDSRGLGETLAGIAGSAARPAFEVGFNSLQNTIIDRINKEIQKVQDEPVNNIDAFLVLEQKRLNRVLPFVERYQTDNTNNRFRVSTILDKLDELSSLSTLGDEDGFNAKLAEINEFASGFVRVDGSAIGIFVDDGLYSDVSANGLGLGDYSSYASGAARLEAIEGALTKLTTSLNIANLNADSASGFRDRVESNLATTSLQIQATKAADQAEKTNEIQKLRENYAQLLNALSLAFETNQTQSQTLSARLLSQPEIPPGSVLNIIS